MAKKAKTENKIIKLNKEESESVLSTSYWLCILLTLVVILGLLISVGIQFYDLPAIASFLGSLVGAAATFTVAYMAREISKQQAKIAEEQRDIARQKLDLDLFNKRFKTYLKWHDALKEYILICEKLEKEQKNSDLKLNAAHRDLITYSEIMGLCFNDTIQTLCHELRFEAYKYHSSRRANGSIEDLERIRKEIVKKISECMKLKILDSKSNIL